MNYFIIVSGIDVNKSENENDSRGYSITFVCLIVKQTPNIEHVFKGAQILTSAIKIIS